MEVATAPSTPKTSIPHHVMRRSYTAPTRSRTVERTVSLPREPEAESAETLFAHNDSKIVSFSTQTSLAKRHSSITQGPSDVQDAPIGTLPWASATERTIAAGVYYFCGEGNGAVTDLVVHRAATHL